MTARFRSSIMAIILVLALLLLGVLALQAYRAEGFHQDTAATILQDYAELGAEELASRVVQQIDYYGATPLLSSLGQRLARDPTAPLPTPEDLRQAEPRLRQATELAVAYFALDVRGWGGGGDVGEDVDDNRLTIGGTLSASTRRWLRDTVSADVLATSEGDWRFRTLFGPAIDDAPVILYALARDAGAPIAAFGLVSTRSAIGAAIEQAILRRPILPSALTRTHPEDSSTAELITGPDGAILYRSTMQYPYGHAATWPVAPHLGGLTATVAIAPTMANALIIGGTPTRRLPLLLALFLLGASTIAAAMILWRREQTLARLRSDFVSGVSHELRTPLAQIRMFAETLQLGRVRSEQERRRSLDIIDQEARRLTHLVENLLYFSRGERQAAHVERRICDVGQVVAEVVESFQPLAAARTCTIASAIEPGVIWHADPDAIRQMVLNLLDNAVKYGPDGQVIRVAVLMCEGAPRVVVEDQGPGIPPAHRARVWQRFWRSERHQASAIAGTGIGLAIVKELADLQGARVWAEPGDGGGARLVVAWPPETKTGGQGGVSPPVDRKGVETDVPMAPAVGAE